uniref:Ovule protein n=1 Tax=Strongyloides venezuelensis TaxID=75913 RepID=A0A0K0FSU7_STRVS
MVYHKVETMVKESCTCYKRLMDANNYIRKKVPYFVLLSICYKLGIYTKCRPNTFLMLSPKLSSKRKCKDFVGMISRNEHRGNIKIRIPQLRRHSLKLF